MGGDIYYRLKFVLVSKGLTLVVERAFFSSEKAHIQYHADSFSFFCRRIAELSDYLKKNNSLLPKVYFKY